MDFHSMKRKELQALCKKLKIPANLTNLEMANRLTSLLKAERRSCLKALDENGCDVKSDVENKRLKKVRFSPDAEMFEFEKSEAREFEIKQRGRRKSVTNEDCVVENAGGPELSEGIGYVTRSRGRRLLEKGVAERKGGKGDVKDDALGSNLPSVVDNVASTGVDNEESRVMTRRSLRKREVVDEEKGKKEDMEKGLKKKESERKLRQGKDKARDTVAEIGESDVKCVEIRADKVLRRSKRKGTKVEDYKLMSSGTVATGSLLKPVDSAVSEGSGPSSRLDIDVAMEKKERSLVAVATRRSRRNASTNEPLITLDDLVAEVNYERKMKKQRRDPVKEQEAILVDSISIELPLAPSSPNVKRSEKVAPAIVAGKFSQKVKRKSKKQTVEIEDSLPENLTTKELKKQKKRSGNNDVADGAIASDTDNEGLIDNLKKQKKRSGNNSSRKSPPKAQDCSNGVNGEVNASEPTELSSIEPGTDTSQSRTNEGAQSDSTDPKGIQVWVELSIDMEAMSRPASLDHLVEDDVISGDKNQEYTEHQGLESVCGDVLERYGNASLHGPCERDESTSSVQDKTSEVNPANSEDSDPNYNGDCSSILSLDRALKQRDLSLSMQTNDGEVDKVAVDRNFEQEAMKCTMSAKADENNPLEENYDASDKFYEPNFPKPSRSVIWMLEDGNINSQEASEEPTDLKGKHLGPSLDANIMETNCIQIEYGTCISRSESTTNVLELNLTSEDPVSGTIVEGGHSFLEDTNVQKQEKIVNVMKKHLEPRKKSLSIQQKDVGPDDGAEAEKHSVDAKISAELPDEENILGKILESDPLDPSGCKLGKLGDLDANVGKDLVSDVDSESLVLAADDFAPHTIDESNESYEDEPKKDGDADLTESCIKETEKVANNFGEATNSKVDESISAMNLNTTLEQREKSPIVHWKGCEAGCIANVNRKYDQVELKCDELSMPAADRPLEEQYYSPKKCWKSGVSDSSKRSDRSMLQDEIDDREDSVGLPKNATGPEKSYEAEPDKDENVAFSQSCVREECTSAKRDNNHKENPINSDNAMATMKYGTGNSPCVSVLHNNEEGTSPWNLDISLEQREHFPVVLDRTGYEADSVAELDRSYGQVELKSDELSKSIEDRPFVEKYHSPRSIPHHGQDSIVCQKNTTCSRKTFEDGPDKDGNIGFTDSHVIKKCISVQINDNSEEVPVYSKNPTGAIGSATGNCLHIPLVDNNEHTGSRNSDLALDQRKQTPVLQMNSCHANNVAEDDRSHEQLELYCDESGESFEDRCLEECYNLPNKCLLSNVSYSSRSANSMLQDEIVRGSDDSVKSQEKSYEAAPEDGNAGSIESSYVIDRYTTAKNCEDNSENPKDAMEEISRTFNFAHISMVDNDEDYISTTNLEITLEKREPSLAMEKNRCETDIVAEENGNHKHKELSCDEPAGSFEDRPSEEQCNSPDKCRMPSALDPSRRILEDVSVNAGENFNKSANFLGTSIVTRSLAAKAVERNCSATEFSSSISNFGSTDPLDSTPTLDGPEYKEVSGDVSKSGHSTFPDTSAQKRAMDAMHDIADVFKTYEEVNNYIDLASYDGGNNNAEDVVDVTKFQEVVLAVQRPASYVNEVSLKAASDTSAESIHSPPSDNDAQQQGDETFADNRKEEDSNGISETTSNFAITELSEAKFNINNFQEKFSCKDQEDNAKENRENLAVTFSQVQFTMSEIDSEGKIVDIADDVSSKLYKHHEMLKESDVVDTINEYIESESTMNSSLRIADTSDTLHIGVSTRIPEPEDKYAEETVGTTGRKFELSVESDDQEKNEAADLEETALGSAWISDKKTATTQSKISDVVADKNYYLGKHFISEMKQKNTRAILIHGTPKKLQMVADMKENLPSFKMEKVGCLTTVKPTTKRPALKDVLWKK